MKIEISRTKKKKTTEKSTEKKITFSKFLAIFSCVLVIISLIDLLVINSKLLSGELITYDFTAFVYLIPSSFGLCAATFAFYYNKSKLENAIKIRYSYVTKLLELKKSNMVKTRVTKTKSVVNNTKKGEIVNEKRKRGRPKKIKDAE